MEQVMSGYCGPERRSGPCAYADRAADQAAKKAVKHVFEILGVNVDHPDQVEIFRQNLRFGATLRSAADKGAVAFIFAIAAGLAASLWLGIKAKMGL